MTLLTCAPGQLSVSRPVQRGWSGPRTDQSKNVLEGRPYPPVVDVLSASEDHRHADHMYSVFPTVEDDGEGLRTGKTSLGGE
jgi:hypothetical protein